MASWCLKGGWKVEHTAASGHVHRATTWATLFRADWSSFLNKGGKQSGVLHRGESIEWAICRGDLTTWRLTRGDLGLWGQWRQSSTVSRNWIILPFYPPSNVALLERPGIGIKIRERERAPTSRGHPISSLAKLLVVERRNCGQRSSRWWIPAIWNSR